MIQCFHELENNQRDEVDPQKDAFHVEKELALSCEHMKRIQSMISTLRIKHPNLNSVLERVGTLASEVLKDMR